MRRAAGPGAGLGASAEGGVGPRELHRALRERLGPRQDWWPGEGPLAVAVLALLVQGVRWEGAWAAWRRLEELSVPVGELWRVDEEALAAALRPARFPRQKARRVRAFLSFVAEELEGDLLRLAGAPDARARLLAVPGIGPETADAILQYALGVPSFVADRYAAHIARRWGMAAENLAELKARVERELEPGAWGEFHALIVDLGKAYCRARPRCLRCPLFDVCPRLGVDAGEG